MKAVIAMDSFKGSLTSMEAGKAAAKGIYKVYPGAEILVKPLADGGEGTVNALVNGMDGTFETVRVTGPLGQPVDAVYGILSENRTAVMEMAQASGITLVKKEKRNPLHTTTYGVGEMIRDAIQKGCRRFLMGIGGSATNDGGIGMLQALGYNILNEKGNPVAPGAAGLKELSFISDTHVIPELKECEFHIACDVTNPLCGETGCSAVFGPQKGATSEMVRDMDLWMKQYASLARKLSPKADASIPGTGAAGGLGFAFLGFTNAVLESGIHIILKAAHMEEAIKDADFVITGEGRLDSQTAMGKAPAGVASLAKKYHKPVIAFSGSAAKDAVLCNKNGIDAFFPIIRGVCSLEEAMNPENARQNMTDTAEQVFLLIKALR
ncbi:MAG: glycerate kinase [Eubacteriales bacterium]|nr:glycerate kinase [Eubacteriales bacterium]